MCHFKDNVLLNSSPNAKRDAYDAGLSLQFPLCQFYHRVYKFSFYLIVVLFDKVR